MAIQNVFFTVSLSFQPGARKELFGEEIRGAPCGESGAGLAMVRSLHSGRSNSHSHAGGALPLLIVTIWKAHMP
jgi:hypothetical protein